MMTMMIRPIEVTQENGRYHTTVLLRFLSAPIDIAWLVYFRIAFGTLMMWEVARYFYFGRIARYYIDPTFHFTYAGFAWVRPWPGDGMYVHFALLGILALCITIGLWYRAAALLFFLGFTYVFLLDMALYLNHFYLIALVSFIMIFLPAAGAFSVDSRRAQIAQSTAPRWTRCLLMFQIGIVYFYGGIAKLNADWLHGEPLRQWLAARADLPLLGPYLTEPWAAIFFSYGGLIFDLLVVPFLLWRRTRLAAFVVALLFHLTNATIFSIGVFPWFMIAATAVFFAPGWPRKWVSRRQPDPTARSVAASQLSPLLLGFLALYVLFQIIIPLRHFFYPGNVSWTEEGHRFSWHMKLRDKEAEARFFVTVAGQIVEVIPANYLTVRQVEKMSARPDMLVQFAVYLQDAYAEMGYRDIEVRAYVSASLNGREPRLLIDPAVDLLAVDTTQKPATWILP